MILGTGPLSYADGWIDRGIRSHAFPSPALPGFSPCLRWDGVSPFRGSCLSIAGQERRGSPGRDPANRLPAGGRPVIHGWGSLCG